MWEVSENMKNQRNERPHSDAKRAAVVAVLAFLAALSSFLGAYPVRAHESNGWIRSSSYRLRWCLVQSDDGCGKPPCQMA